MIHNKRAFLFTIGKLAYKIEDTDHWHLGIYFLGNGEEFKKIIDLSIIKLGCFYWQVKYVDTDYLIDFTL